jgi:UrcA family protein
MIRQLVRIVGVSLLGFCVVSVNATAPSAAGVEVDSTRRSSDLEVRRKVVNFADLNLSREAGVKTLYRRISVAANYVCAPLSYQRDLGQAAQWRACREKAIANAVAEIDHPLLSELDENDFGAYRIRRGHRHYAVELIPRTYGLARVRTCSNCRGVDARSVVGMLQTSIHFHFRLQRLPSA